MKSHYKTLTLLILALLAFFLLKKKPTSTSEAPATISTTTIIPFKPINGNSPEIKKIDTAQTPVVAEKKDSLIQKNKETEREEKYNNFIPELDSYQWLLKDFEYSAKYDDPKWAGLVHQPTGLLTRLIDLKKDDIISLHEEAFFHNLENILSEKKIRKIVYQKRFLIADAHFQNLNKNLPICILNVNTDVDQPDGKDSYQFFVKEVIFPLREYPNFSGVRIVNNVQEKPNRASWIQSIDCIFYSTSMDDNRYQDLRLIHMLSTFGVHGSAKIE